MDIPPPCPELIAGLTGSQSDPLDAPEVGVSVDDDKEVFLASAPQTWASLVISLSILILENLLNLPESRHYS